MPNILPRAGTANSTLTRKREWYKMASRGIEGNIDPGVNFGISRLLVHKKSAGMKRSCKKKGYTKYV